MMKILPLLVMFVSLVVDTTNGFAFDVFSAFRPNPALEQLAHAQNQKKFDIRFDLETKDNERHFYLNGLNIELLDEAIQKKQSTGLPGANGPNPKVSR